MYRKLRRSHATFTNIQSPTDRILFTNTKTLVQETCNQMKDFDNNSVTTNEESFHARNTKLEKENSNVAGNSNISWMKTYSQFEKILYFQESQHRLQI